MGALLDPYNTMLATLTKTSIDWEAVLAICKGGLVYILLPYTVLAMSQSVYRRMTSPFRYMDGPPNPSWLLGNFGRNPFAVTQMWQARYGPTFKFHSVFSSLQLYTTDTVALQRIINHSDIYQKSPMVRFNLARLLGRGLLVVEDDEHTKLRKIMNPAFGVSQIRGLTQLFLDKSLELCDVWKREETDKSGWAQINVMVGLKAMTLDVIGLAGFNYEFHALNPAEKPNELDEAFKEVFVNSTPRKIGLKVFLSGRFPFLRLFFRPSQKLVDAHSTMSRIGNQLLQDAKSATAAGEKEAGRRDLLSLLVQSNMSGEVSDSHRLSDAVVIAQLPTFFVAGHETTSTATTWALYALARSPQVQATLRAELLSMGTESPSLDALNSLPYLEKVVREVMRLHSPVAFTNRMAMRDDVIPLGTPYTDTKGVQHDRIPVRKGQQIYVPVAAVNRDPRIWGADAAEFNPDRWDSVPEGAAAIPGVWAHLFSFLGGPHNCIGWRFSLAELKSLLYTLIRTFEFEFAVPLEELGATKTAVQRPMLLSEPDKPQLPMRVRRVQA
ncbi:cytochrome P450 [Mycena crocata]|nr:cytochrome P450 [Mycena crocata]